MPLPPITLTRAEPVRLLSPWDDAIDLEATPDDVLAAYARTDDLDASALTLRPGVEPVWFTVRALGPREVRAVSALIPWDDAPPQMDQAVEDDQADGAPGSMADRLRASAWAHEAHTQYLRFGLVEVAGLEGWEAATREPFLGLTPWTVDAVGALHPESALWLGSAVARLSRLEKKSD